MPLQVLRGEACHSDYVGPGALPFLRKTGCSLAELHSHTVARAFQCCILLCVCLFLFLCVVVVAIVLSVTVFLCVVVVASLSGGFCGSKAFESCCEGFGACKGCPKCATWQFRSPIETACGASGGTMAKQAGRLRKLLRRVLRFKGLGKVLRGF